MKNKKLRIKKILIKNLYSVLFLNLLRVIKLSLFLLCFSVSFNISSSSKSVIKPFSSVFSEEAGITKGKAAKAVWKIKISHTGSGSGFFISKNQIVTNFHVIEHAESIGLEDVILVQEGNPEQLKVKRIVRLSILDDLAVLEIEGSVSHFLSLPSEELNASKKLYVLGYPKGKFKEIKQKGVLKDDSFFSDLSNSKGASGSPVLNELYQLIGVLTHNFSNLLLFTNVKKIKSFIESEHFLCKSLNIKECFRSSRETFEESIQEIKEAGDYFKMGMYYIGLRGEKNLQLGIDLLKQSAKQGDVYAQYQLAVALIKGLRVEKNLQLGIELLKQSADQNFAPAQHKLGRAYYEGIWIKQKLPLARELLIKSALQGHVPALYELGIMLIKGLGGGKNLHLGMELLRRSAAQGYALALDWLAIMEDSFKAIKLLEKPAAQGSDLAQYELGLIYYYGKGVKDLSKAREWLEKSAAQGNAKAKRMLYIIKMEQGFQTLKKKCLDIFRN